jgi:methionyl-tRNA formyltransferase
VTRGSLRVGFAGTPAFAAAALSSLIRAGYTIPVVLSQPDRPKGRGLATAASEVAVLAAEHSLDLRQPATLKGDADVAGLRAIGVDVLVVAAYGLILPQPVLEWPRFGCLNIHASLLPRWRGAAPIARAIEAGDSETGVTIMQMDRGLDTGAMIERRALPIDARETAGSLTPKLAALGAAAIADTLATLATLATTGTLAATPQPADGVTYASKVQRAQARIDWTRDDRSVDCAIRAFDPWPAAWTTFDGEIVKIWRASPLPDAGAGTPVVPGTVVRAHAQGLDVACGRGVLRIDELQPANARRMAAAAFVAGRRIAPGARFGA